MEQYPKKTSRARGVKNPFGENFPFKFCTILESRIDVYKMVISMQQNFQFLGNAFRLRHSQGREGEKFPALGKRKKVSRFISHF